MVSIEKKLACDSLSKNQLKRILDLLEQDFYINYERKNKTYKWRHEPLRLIWVARRDL
jgi:hypothetical protein